MKNTTETLIEAKEILIQESEAIVRVAELLDETFYQVIKTLFECKGRVVITGIGKSALIGQKIVATLNSTGTPSIFMHAADAIHGDLGIIQPNDVVICISNSGNTPEIKVIAPIIKSIGNILIAMVGNLTSYLTEVADYVLNTSVSFEAGKLQLAPTSSTTVQLAMGDAIAMSLLSWRGFTAQDFAKYHPGGALGKKLYLRASDICQMNQRPVNFMTDSMQKVIMEITTKRLGATVVVNADEEVLGIVTDGDLRRLLQKEISLTGLTAGDIMSSQPKTIDKESLAIEANKIMSERKITQLIVCDGEKYLGIIHLHDLSREGII